MHRHAGSALLAPGGPVDTVSNPASASEAAETELARRLGIMDLRGVDQAIVIFDHGYLRPRGLEDTCAENDAAARYRDRTPERFPIRPSLLSTPSDPNEATREYRLRYESQSQLRLHRTICIRVRGGAGCVRNESLFASRRPPNQPPVAADPRIRPRPRRQIPDPVGKRAPPIDDLQRGLHHSNWALIDRDDTSILDSDIGSKRGPSRTVDHARAPNDQIHLVHRVISPSRAMGTPSCPTSSSTPVECAAIDSIVY